MTLNDPIDIQITPGGKAVWVQVAGELDFATAPALAAALESAMRHELAVVVELDQLDFMDCSGLRVLLDAAERAGASGGSVAVTRVRPPVHRLLELTDAMTRLRLTSPRHLEAAA